MTATRDRRSDPEEDAEPAWDERSIFGRSRGLPWWGPVVLAFGLAAIAAAFDMQREDVLGRVYQATYIIGCVAAVCLVRRRSLFGPMVQPPLVFAVTAVGAVVLLAPDPGGASGLRGLIFSVALPLTSNFPTMAITTGVTAGIGLFRMWRERDPEAEDQSSSGRSLSRERPDADRGARGRRTDPDAVELDDPDEYGGPRRRRSSDAGPPGEPSRRGGPDGRRGAAGGRRGDPDIRRGTSRRGEGDPDGGPEGRRGFRGRPSRDARPDQGMRDRDSRAADRAARGRGRDSDPSPRRREPTAEARPRRDDRSRDPADRGAPVRQSRRRQDPFR